MTVESNGTRTPGRVLVLITVLVAEALDLLDSTVTNVAAPEIAKDLGAGTSLIQWLGTSYALTLGSLLIMGGRLGDKFGRRRMFLLGTAGFTITSVACGLAPNGEFLVIARMVQGAFGALLMPQGFGLLATVYPRNEIGKAFGAFGPTLGLAAVGGPILAGFIIKADLFGLSWRPMFLINILLGGLCLLVAARALPKDADLAPITIDGLGAGLLSLSMLALLGGVIQGSESQWAPLSLGVIGIGCVAFLAFAVRQRTALHPIIERSVLRNRGFTSGLIVGMFFFGAVAGALYAFSLFMQLVLGYDSFGTSLGLIPSALGIVVSTIAGYALIARLGRTLLMVGLAVFLVGVLWLWVMTGIDGTHLSPIAISMPIFVCGLGMGTGFATLFDIAIADVSQGETGSASGALNSVQQLANAAGVAIMTTLFLGATNAIASTDGLRAALTGVALALLAALLCSCWLPRRTNPNASAHG